MLKHSLTHLIVKFDTKLVLHFLTLTIIAKKKKKNASIIRDCWSFSSQILQIHSLTLSLTSQELYQIGKELEKLHQVKILQFLQKTIPNPYSYLSFSFFPQANGLGRQATVQKRCWIWQSNSNLNSLIEFVLKNWDI